MSNGLKALFKLIWQTKPGLASQETKSVLIAEFTNEEYKERAMIALNKHVIWEPAHVMEELQRLNRLLMVRVPGVDEASKERLLKNRIIKSYGISNAD